MKNPEKQRIKKVDAAMILVPEKLLIFWGPKIHFVYIDRNIFNFKFNKRSSNENC